MDTLIYSLLTKKECHRVKRLTEIRNVPLKHLTVEELGELYDCLDGSKRKFEIFSTILCFYNSHTHAASVL